MVYKTVEGLGLAWAGGRSLVPEGLAGKTSDAIRATDVIWDFFLKHPRPANGAFVAPVPGRPFDAD